MEDASLPLENLADQQWKMLRVQEIAEAVREIRSPAAKRTVGFLNFFASCKNLVNFVLFRLGLAGSITDFYGFWWFV